MTVDVPVRLGMTQEAAAFGGRERAPELGSEMTDEGHHLAPVAAQTAPPREPALGSRTRLAAPTTPWTSRISPLPCTAVGLKIVCPSGSKPWREIVRTIGISPALETQRQRNVHHRESSADDQYRVLPLRAISACARDRGRRPDDSTSPRAHECTAEGGFPNASTTRSAGIELRSGKLREQRLAGGIGDGRRVIAVTSPNTRLSVTCGGADALRLIEHLLEIISVERARHEILGIGLRVHLSHERQELHRILGVHRQAAGRHVQHVRHIVGGVGDAARRCWCRARSGRSRWDSRADGVIELAASTLPQNPAPTMTIVCRMLWKISYQPEIRVELHKSALI